MGYTHYFRQQRAATEDEWQAITSHFQRMLQYLEVPVTPPEVTRDVILFNGVGADEFETMLLVRSAATEFQFCKTAGTMLLVRSAATEFCKTAGKPYDVAVTALLVLAHHLAPGTWRISSDGKPEQWSEGLALARRVCPTAQNPLGLAVNKHVYHVWHGGTVCHQCGLRKKHTSTGFTLYLVDEKWTKHTPSCAVIAADKDALP